MRLEGKRVLITGTAGGQGEAAQRLFAAEGARVIGCDLQDGAAEKTAAELREAGHDVYGDTVDLSDAAASTEWVDSAAERLGGILGQGDSPMPAVAAPVVSSLPGRQLAQGEVVREDDAALRRTHGLEPVELSGRVLL